MLRSSVEEPHRATRGYRVCMSTPATLPVALVHGWAGSYASTWKAPGVAELLTDIGRRPLGIDLLGHGDAEKPHDPEAYRNLHEWLLTRLPDEPVDIVGFSLGALTTLRALASSPSRFRKVVLAGIGDGVFETTSHDMARRIVQAIEGEDTADATALLFRQYAHQPGNDPKALAAVMKRPPSEPLVPSILGLIDNEVMVCIGDKDFAAPADALARSFPNGKLVILKNTDHFATPNAFSFIDAMLDFLNN
jgi:pimeloyl-ACP methyl ester carboxylesterase